MAKANATSSATSPARDPGPSDDHTPWTFEPVESGFDAGFYQVANSKSWVIATRLVYEDARLLAAAPDLLEAAELVIARWEHGDLAEAARKLGAAIFRARGDVTC